MSKGGMAKLQQRLQESLAKNQELRAGIVERDARIVQMAQAHSEPARSSKLREFWTSTPTWAAIGAMAGCVGAQLSLWLMAIAVWCVLLFDFIRLGFFNKGWGRWAGNIIFAVVSAGVLFCVARYAPHPNGAPSIDAQLSAFANRFPALLNPPKPAVTQISNSIPPAPAAVILPKPDVVVEPEIGMAEQTQPGSFTFVAYNKPGADIEHLVYSADYFIAQRKKDAPANSVIFQRYLSVPDFPLLPNNGLLRQNNGLSFPIAGAPVAAGKSRKSYLQYLMGEDPIVLKLACIRIRLNYDRLSDHRPFDSQKTYEERSSDGYKTVVVLASPQLFSNPAKTEMLTFSEIAPYLRDARRWRDVGVVYKSPPDDTMTIMPQ